MRPLVRLAFAALAMTVGAVGGLATSYFYRASDAEIRSSVLTLVPPRCGGSGRGAREDGRPHPADLRAVPCGDTNVRRTGQLRGARRPVPPPGTGERVASDLDRAVGERGTSPIRAEGNQRRVRHHPGRIRHIPEHQA